MKKFFLSDITIGLLIAVLVLGAYVMKHPFIETLELKTYDLRASLRQTRVAPGDIAIVAIDDESITKLGRWPWPRSVVADGITAIKHAGAKVIGLNILFTEPERNQGLIEIKNLKEAIPPLFSADKKPLNKKFQSVQDSLLEQLAAAEIRLDNDTKLCRSIADAGTIVLPMYFNLGPSLGEELPALSSQTITVLENPEDTARFAPPEGNHPAVPLALFADKATAVGHVNLIPDVDGSIRSEAPVISFQGDYYPSFAVQIIRAYLNIPINALKLRLGNHLALGGRVNIPIDTAGRLMITFNGPAGTFNYFSFYDILNNKIDPAALKGKIVLVGHLATGIADLSVTPAGHNFPGTEIIATVIENVLHHNFTTRPAWATNAELGVLAFIGLFVAFLLPRLKAFAGFLISFILFAGIAGAGVYAFAAYGYWLKIVYPLLLLTAGYIIIVSKRFFITEKKKELSEAGAIETNKMLGLSFQGQGMLDLAFEKFRKCPVDDNMKELLYNLGLDFERKRQFNKAAAVYEHVMKVDPAYKGIDEKVKHLKAAADGAVFGMNKGSAEGTVIIEGAAATSPTLGRYEIVKELGRGAMGTVYLGKDPKINRLVAIKTLRFDGDTDEATLKTVKERFFREAESAGNLNHPNIIKIFDAGEDNELSYIAMELLEGEDLKKYTDKNNLLPLETVKEYMIHVADGLDYAHKLGVVHRDIKPANIMLLKDGSLRITDFGIARITASSKTQTGTVLGTPSYMSPEQLSGKKVDGRSDLFSLGAMFFELITGTKPFEGDSIATLLFKIANEKHADLLELRPDVPPYMAKIINKLLCKNPDERYQTGADVVKDLKNAS
jgi:CHASE2 domain-containing sensor protein